MGRKRKNEIKLRANENEYKRIIKLVKESGLTRQEFMLRAALNVKILSKEYAYEINKQRELVEQYLVELRKIGNNINQMARVCNSIGRIDEEKYLREKLNEINKYMERGEDIWQFLKSLIIRDARINIK